LDSLDQERREMTGETTDGGRNEATAADLLLRALHSAGIDHFFANAGTDFPPIVESFARAAENRTPVPRPMLVPHENAAVAMAHGVYMISGRPQAVMVHTSVGTGNTLNALINASRDNVPMLLLAGRTPVTEHGALHGRRNRYIHWAQEMFDQAGMLREIVKWDYELRVADHVTAALGRAFEIAMTAPRGPVYLTLPREILAAAASGAMAGVSRAVPAPPHPDPAAIETLADWLAVAQRPLIVTANAGRTAEGAAALARLAERFAFPVIAFNPRFLALPSAHPLHQGHQPRPLLDTADVMLVLDCDVPWIPALEGPPPSCRVAHIGEDPTFSRYPMRSFPADLAIAAATGPALAALERALAARLSADAAALAQRRQMLAERSAARRAQALERAAKDAHAAHVTPEALSRCIGDAVGVDAIIVNEYPLRLDHCPRSSPGTYFGTSPAGGLGWGLPAALGAKLAAPERLVVATLGDGAYVFANPTACHWVAAAQRLPILVVVFNNSAYGAVRNASLDMYGAGAAARGKGLLLADLAPSPAFEMLVEASGGVGLRVEKPAELPAALARAVDVVTREQRQALVNVICRY
jgi:acetolactate synthase I/II/III large subunit